MLVDYDLIAIYIENSIVQCWSSRCKKARTEGGWPGEVSFFKAKTVFLDSYPYTKDIKNTIGGHWSSYIHDGYNILKPNHETSIYFN